MRRVFLACVLLVPTLAAAQEQTVRIGVARSVSNGAELIAIEKGYFKEHNIKVEIELLESSANAIALLAQGRLNMIAGGISAGYFNALEKNLPITIVADRVTTPIGHNLMLRPDLKDSVKDLRGLKGKVIASNGPGSISTYETGKMLETVGLSIADVEVKIFPFTQMALALNNKAVDAAIVIPPFVSQFIEQGHALAFADADELIKPTPLTIAVIMVNTDWAKQNRDLVRNYFHAWLRGVREYCQAYHGGSTRGAIVDVLIKSRTETRPELLEKYPWPARNPNGRLNVASMADIQAWYLKNKFITAEIAPDRLVDNAYVDEAAQKLGAFVLEKPDSKLPGCR
ncbi:MAG TPA: ABC transporter substrate-binding protein [Xanthobacteraceae bacterium]|nr:ABC transporter substrate-binding protein [Xanthobacteraceae bacterium]